MPTNLEYSVAKLSTRKMYAKIYLLNYNLQMVDEWSEVVLSCDFSESATSDIRKTISLVLTQTDSSFDIAEGNKIWLDKYVRIEIGTEDIITGEIAYTNMGVYLINNPSRVYSATENTITIEGVDLMAKMTGLRDGELDGLTYIIPQGTNVRTAIIDTIALAGFTQFIVEECPYAVPNDIKIDIGGKVYDILKQLRDIVPQYQIYFDDNGVFHYELIPSGADESPIATDELWKENLIGYSINNDFENIKNSITVFGKTHDVTYYNTATVSGSNYLLTLSGLTALRDNLKIGFTAPSKITDAYINVNSYGAKPLKNEDGTFAVLFDTANVYYVAKYQTTGDYFLFMGEIQPIATVEETNLDSPFYVNGTFGKVHINLFGGEYDNIYMTALAVLRAKWELYNRCRIQDSITLSLVPIYWLRVNKVIEITLPNKQGVVETNKYIIKNISTAYNGTQTVTAMRYYAYYYDEELTVMDDLAVSDNLVVE